MDEIEARIKALKRHGITDSTGWVGQRWFIDFIDEVIEILLEMQSARAREDLRAESNLDKNKED